MQHLLQVHLLSVRSRLNAGGGEKDIYRVFWSDVPIARSFLDRFRDLFFGKIGLMAQCMLEGFDHLGCSMNVRSRSTDMDRAVPGADAHVKGCAHQSQVSIRRSEQRQTPCGIFNGYSDFQSVSLG